MPAPGDRRFRTLARRVTLAGVALCPGGIIVGSVWMAATEAWPHQTFPQGPFPFVAVAGLLALCGGTTMQAFDGAVRVVRWIRGRRRSERTGG